MAARNELSPTVFFGHLTPCDEKTNCRLSVLVALVIPLVYVVVNIMTDVVVSMQRLGFASRADPHGSTRMDIGL